MINRDIAYSGINSFSFGRGYDVKTGVFDKSRVPGIKDDRLFSYLPPFVFEDGGRVLNFGSYAGRYATLRSAGKDMGFPLVFSFDLRDVGLDSISVTASRRGLGKRVRIVDPGNVKVKDVYMVDCACGSFFENLIKLDIEKARDAPGGRDFKSLGLHLVS